MRPAPGSCGSGVDKESAKVAMEADGVLLPRKQSFGLPRGGTASRGDKTPEIQSFEQRQSNQQARSYGEFDPGSERTLMACLIHASRAPRKGSGERVSNA